ncbi:hypothetical protein EVAR_71337_1 [Eumeta japonica]|uniref:Uncharacterized protein n=1 Tax=Eumeta variegata TaxID=151549 RepID=A0A4C2AF73_EUMVA|nr:hypothetical protein EVAR_71337_1 [Eumeta japonica]
MLQDKIHRLEAQRNATRVMEENQQAKLKQSIEMKTDQENDRKQFEDLEFQYLEEESEWHAYHEELKTEEKLLMQQIEIKRLKCEILKDIRIRQQLQITIANGQ